MNIVKKSVIGVIALSAVAIGASAFADRNSGHHGRMIERISSHLELDDNQGAALDNFAALLTETRELMQGSSTNVRTEISEMLVADTFDQGKALGMINDRAAALQTKAPELVAAAAVFFDGLSAEQKTQIQKFAKKGRHGRH